jgi:hypothetical protein
MPVLCQFFENFEKPGTRTRLLLVLRKEKKKKKKTRVS